MRRALLLLIVLVGVASAQPAAAAPGVQYGIQDDAWLQFGPGTLEQRIATLDRLGVDIVRFTIDWSKVEPQRGDRDWSSVDPVLNGLRARGIRAVATLYGTPGWANGGQSSNVAPTSASTFAGFAAATAKRYSWVKDWLIWNEPNQRRWLRPTTPSTYVTKLLNPAYAAIKQASGGTRVAGGVTAPRGSTGGVSPVDWIRGMRAAGARLDAYAHHPYPLDRFQTPTTGACGHCSTITMASLERLLREVSRAWGSQKRIWLTEYGYQTNPPDRALGVSPARQAQYIGEAARRVFNARNVDMLIHYLYRDDGDLGGFQSGLLTAADVAKPSRNAFMVAATQAYRSGSTTAIWGHVRPGDGRQFYVLQQFREGAWRTVNGAYRTTASGFLYRYVRAGKGSKLRIMHTPTRTISPVLTVR
ncbi:MAG: cellulase family glycosylhydrolase [Actinomycetota bacterium]|nr:cellulase family glycosylhydrolase [Actinomycetota bacterium]